MSNSISFIKNFLSFRPKAYYLKEPATQHTVM
nr:MAG TPA: hypothetical protein [Caudoviricetes sp.]